jgi:hypothetical protein
MKVENIVEHEDGSATITLRMTNEEHQTVMEGALIRAISLGVTAKHEGWSGFTPEEWRTIVNNAIEAKNENNHSR